MKITFEKGLNADALPSELGDGFVSDCTDIRFRAGFAEVVGGKSATIVSYSNTPKWLGQLYTAANTFIVAVGSTSGTAEVYTLGGAASVTDITRETEGATISNATAAGTTVTITTATNHGRATNDVVSAWGFTPSTYNVESASITVTSATAFTYVVPSAPASSPATTMGMYSRDGVLSPFGGSQPYSGGELNGLLIINSPTAGCYYWAGDSAIPIRKINGSYVAAVGVPFGNFIVQLAPVIDGVRFSSRICWSTAAEPGSVPSSFTASTTNQAGDVDKPEIGDLVFAKALGDDLIVYGTKGRIVMRYIGGNDVFQFTRLPGDEGLYSTTTVAEFPGGHVFVDLNRRVLVHSGGVCQDISTGRVQSITGAGGYTIPWVVSHARQSEIWVGYLTDSFTAGVSSQYALIWDWNEKTWGKTVVDDEKFGLSATPTTAGNQQELLFVGAAGALQQYDANDVATSFAAGFIERRGITAGDADVVKNLQRSRWDVKNITGLGASFSVSHGSSMYAGTTETFKDYVTYTVGTTDYVNSRATGGRFLGIRMQITPTSAMSNPPHYGIRVRSVDLDFTAGGKR